MTKKILLASLVLCSSAVCFADDFNFNHQAINPGCIALFDDIVAAKPYVTAVSLDQCSLSEGVSPVNLKDSQGGHYFYHNNKDAQAGVFGYQVLAQQKNLFVVKTYSSGGGSGTFTNLLLLQLAPAQIIQGQQSTNFTQLTLQGFIPGGDRCFGDFAEVHLKGNQLQIKQYDNDTAVDCAKTKSFSVRLPA